MERQERLGEEGEIGKRHHRHLIRHLDFNFHANTVGAKTVIFKNLVENLR
jgi:hypothetical protein